MIRFSDAAIARGSKAPNQPSDGLASTRAAPRLPCLRTSCAYAAPPRSIQYIRTANLRAMATLGHRVSSTEFQSLIVLPQCQILAHRGIDGFDQQPAHHGVALFADGSYPALFRLVRQGLLKAHWDTSENNRRTKFYELTAAGRKLLRQEEDGWNGLVAAIASALKAQPEET
jgi:hypothetical protein